MGHLFDAMPPKVTKRWVPVTRRSKRVPDADHLSALPDAPLLYIMSFPKAWEVVRTCVLSRRWRHLWKSVPCIDIRLRTGDYIDMPQGFTDFVHHLFCRRDASAKLDTLHLRSSDLGCAHNEGDARLWIHKADLA
ncbi:hypothetical protein HU200_056161 [Digitaria exilis]|uniref:F-box domain-containing protein n=1 Tax=Digitaria exilis TaxID=1010633 RepID=A0A835AD55_9POAL|nr:hypothetical protein HU200_056161 [Digitaria exilis]